MSDYDFWTPAFMLRLETRMVSCTAQHIAMADMRRSAQVISCQPRHNTADDDCAHSTHGVVRQEFVVSRCAIGRAAPNAGNAACCFGVSLRTGSRGPGACSAHPRIPVLEV